MPIDHVYGPGVPYRSIHREFFEMFRREMLSSHDPRSSRDREELVGRHARHLAAMDRLPVSGSAASADIARGEPGTSHPEAGREDPSGYVALTFDDGPTPATLPTLLDRLLAAGARATFFNRGDHAEARPDLVRAQQEARMWIGNHTETHPHLPDISEPASFAEILRAQRILHRITGEWPSLFRPPYGETNDQVRADEARLDLLEVLWTVDSRDWAGATPDEIVAAARALRPGGIFLMHDWAQASIDALPQIISELRDRGLHPGKIAFTPRQIAFADTPFHAIAVAP